MPGTTPPVRKEPRPATAARDAVLRTAAVRAPEVSAARVLACTASVVAVCLPPDDGSSSAGE
ncbi:hypothetical protein [Streptacidiphilus rugosus]|uniref:hypothetical protein n=1 Tax=Streptacidiphilus rugosus TaxID=405783 RepID=UPI000560923C|nr:hypothetical protein [Streptacidiphilus rugosus]